jgi:uncharacterized protein (UPF0332 family)
MTLSDDERKTLETMRFAKADSALADASILVATGSTDGAINRCYYAMFHAASALAIHDDCDFHKHRALISWFHREYMKTGRISRQFGEALQEAFERRCDADYTDAASFGADEISTLLGQARQFVAEVKKIVGFTSMDETR